MWWSLLDNDEATRCLWYLCDELRSIKDRSSRFMVFSNSKVESGEQVSQLTYDWYKRQQSTRTVTLFKSSRTTMRYPRWHQSNTKSTRVDCVLIVIVLEAIMTTPTKSIYIIAINAPGHDKWVGTCMVPASSSREEHWCLRLNARSLEEHVRSCETIGRWSGPRSQFKETWSLYLQSLLELTASGCCTFWLGTTI